MSEPIRVVCPGCKTAYRLKVVVRPGARITCSRCGGEIVVPGPPAAPTVLGSSGLAGSPDDRQITLTQPPAQPPEGFKPSGGYPGSPAAGEGGPREAPTLPLPSPVSDRSDESDRSDRSDRSDSSPALEEEAAETVLMAADPAAGRYIEQAVIGRGGMGEVVLCIDRNIRRPVALKRIRSDAAQDANRRARFVEEAQVTGQLEHPNIVPVHELERAPDGTIYFTMKLVKGRSLAEILADLKSARPYAPRGDEESDAPRPPASPPAGFESRGRVSRDYPPAGEETRGRKDPHAPTLSELLQIFLKVCDGVAFAHSRGVVHRDLKPANIMVGDYGEVLVMDWGLAKLLRAASSPARPYAPRGDDASDAPRPPASPPAGEETRGRADGPGAAPSLSGGRGEALPRPGRRSASPLQDPGLGARAGARVFTDRHDEGVLHTMDGTAIGTPAYMSPEQANGELDKIDERSDIYSLGAILYEILALERAIVGQTPYEVLANVVKGKIPPPEQRAPGRHVPRELSAIAMKCLSKGRSHRYPSVLDLRRDIGLFLEGRSVSARPDTFAQALVKLVKRNKPVSAAIAAAALILIALTTAFIFRVTHERDRARASEQRALDNAGKALAAQKQQRDTALAASKELADQAIRAASEGRVAEADVRADAALRVMPDGPWGHYALATVAHDKKDLASALKHIEEALACDPAHPPSKLLHATLLAASGDLAQWEKLAAEAEKSTDWKSLVAAGDVLFAADRYAQSVKAYQRAVSLADLDPALPAGTKSDVKDKSAKASACLRMVGFYDSIRDLPGAEQKSRLEAKLKEIFGLGTVTLEGGKLSRISLANGMYNVRWLDPLKGLPLTSLRCNYTRVSDLGPLTGMPLTELECYDGPTVRDLSPLKGMPLTFLTVSGPVSDLGPLAGMALTELNCARNQVKDLAPLKGMPLRRLDCAGAPIRDLSPLAGMRLTYLNIGNTGVVDLSPLKGMPLETLLMRMLGVTSFAPLKGMPLAVLNCDRGRVTDLTPLQGMPLSYLHLNENPIGDLGPLSGAPLKQLWLSQTQVRDLAPLAGMKLVEFWPPARKQLTAESLKVVDELEKQGCKVHWPE